LGRLSCAAFVVVVEGEGPAVVEGEGPAVGEGKGPAVACSNMSDDGGAPGRFLHRADGILGKLFGSCSNDPKSSVFRGWIIAVVLMAIYIVLSIVESAYNSAIENSLGSCL
jgi:hypothetical protein